MPKPFLTAEWRKLAIANYAIDPQLLQKYVPRNTELDFFNGTCYVSLVGFLFINTQLKGISIPFHKNFEEVNLRFYVKYKDSGGEWKRGVVFVKEIVPKPMLTFVANTIYKEKYQTLPMSHEWSIADNGLIVSYHWESRKQHSIKVVAEKKPRSLESGSEAEFITEHYWGYTRVDEYKTMEYKVEHPQWLIYDVKEYCITADFGELYGSEFAFLNQATPISVFLAEGSEISVLDTKRV